MDELGHYIRIHLTGAAGGIELFSRGADLYDPAAREVVEGIRTELHDERRRLLAIAGNLGVRPAPLATAVAKIGEKVGRLKPNGHPLRRTRMTDLVDLEAMRIALAGKISGWEGLLTVVDEYAALPRDEIADLLAQALRQLDQITNLHAEAAQRALQAGRGTADNTTHRNR